MFWPAGEGWSPMVTTTGYVGGRFHGDYVEIELMREGWDEPKLAYPEQIPPELNAIGLFWRPAGPLRVHR